jgi:hypothetical protein
VSPHSPGRACHTAFSLLRQERTLVTTHWRAELGRLPDLASICYETNASESREGDRVKHRLLSGARTCRAQRSLHSGWSVITGEE